MKPNTQQITLILQVLLGASGPFTKWLTDHGFPAESRGDLINMIMTIIAVLTPFVAMVWGSITNTNKAQVAAVAKMPSEAKTAAIATLTPEAQASLVSAVPAQVQIATVANMADVQKVVVNNDALDGAAKAAADPNLKNVITEAVDNKGS